MLIQLTQLHVIFYHLYIFQTCEIDVLLGHRNNGICKSNRINILDSILFKIEKDSLVFETRKQRRISCYRW